MKSVLISIQPKWCQKISKGEKTIEVRKTRPKIETPFKCYIYMTATKERCRFWEYITAYQNSKGDIVDGSQKVICDFVCDRITDISVVVNNCNEDYNHVYHNDECKGSCLTWKELQEYSKDKPLYAWHISELKIYDKPKELSEFVHYKKFDWWDYGYHENKRQTELCNLTRPPQSWCYVEELQEKQK